MPASAHTYIHTLIFISTMRRAIARLIAKVGISAID
jgi:hypothetical protein